jgi:hypothetical protein
VNDVILFRKCVIHTGIKNLLLHCKNPYAPVPPEAETYKSEKMNHTRKAIPLIIMLSAIILLIGFGGCTKNDPAPAPARTTTYNLMVKDVLGVTGTATFVETNSTTTTIIIALNNAPSGIHPAELRTNSAVEGGTVVIALNPVDATGKSSTNTTTMTYAQLVAYDGFIQVHKSENEHNVILAQGDIGGNVITSTKTTYTLDTVGTYGVSGTALFEKRVNGNTLVTISLTGVIPGDAYPATINLGSVSSVGGGPVVKTLTNVDGTTGKSYSNIRKLDSGIDITYDNWLVYDGYINVYQTTVSLGNIICHGNIGSN